MDSVRIYVLTWNVACKPPEDSLPLDRLLGWDDPQSALPDIYVIGLQEVNAQVQNLVLDALFDDPWTKLFRVKLSEKGLVKVRTVRLQGLVLSVFVKRSALLSVRDLAWEVIRTGMGGLWGNKGGVAVRMTYSGVSVCLVNTHLPPHDHNMAARVADYNTIVEQMKFPKHKPTDMIFYHDYVVWLGDHNFRLDESISHDEVLSRLRSDELEWLLERDQMNQVRRDGHAFAELTEAPFRFPPTFKYHFNSSEFDPKRRPAWTDRILYRVLENVYENLTLGVTVDRYTSLPEYSQSDHKPVVANVRIRAISHHSERLVTFSPLKEWFIDRENQAVVTLGDDVKANDSDWIGLYKSNFTSLDEYLMFVYVTPRAASADSPAASRRQHDGRKRTFSFPDHSVRSRGRYTLLYVTDDWGAVLGISDDFDAVYSHGGVSGPHTPIRRLSVASEHSSYPPIDSTPLRMRRPSPSTYRARLSSSDSSD